VVVEDVLKVFGHPVALTVGAVRAAAVQIDIGMADRVGGDMGEVPDRIEMEW